MAASREPCLQFLIPVGMRYIQDRDSAARHARMLILMQRGDITQRWLDVRGTELLRQAVQSRVMDPVLEVTQVKQFWEGLGYCMVHVYAKLLDLKSNWLRIKWGSRSAEMLEWESLVAEEQRVVRAILATRISKQGTE